MPRLKNLFKSTFSSNNSAENIQFDPSLLTSCQEISGSIVCLSPYAKHAEAFARQLKLELAVIYPELNAHFTVVTVPRSFDLASSYLSRRLELEVGDEEKQNLKHRCLITLGHWESHLVSYVRRSFDNPIAQYSCTMGVFDSTSGSRRGAQSIGIESTPVSASEYVDAVLAIRPTIKEVALLVDARTQGETFNKYISGRADDFKTEFAKHNVHAKVTHWTPDDPSHAIAALPSVDAVVVLEGAAVHVHKEDFFARCRAGKVMICSTELDSVFAGAGLGSGITINAFAKPLVSSFSRLLLGENQKLRTIIPPQEGLRYNPEALKAQGIELSARQKALLAMRSIYSFDLINY